MQLVNTLLWVCAKPKIINHLSVIWRENCRVASKCYMSQECLEMSFHILSSSMWTIFKRKTLQPHFICATGFKTKIFWFCKVLHFILFCLYFVPVSIPWKCSWYKSPHNRCRRPWCTSQFTPGKCIYPKPWRAQLFRRLEILLAVSNT